MKTPPEFVIAKRMPVGVRLKWVAGLALVGVVVQLTASVVVGWVFVLAAALLGAIASRSNKPTIVGKAEWKTVTPAELEQADRLIMGARKVSRQAAALSANSATGCGLGALLLICIGVVAALSAAFLDLRTGTGALLLPVLRGGPVAVVVALDALTLLAPIWLSGLVKAWEPPQMNTRLAQLMFIYRAISNDPRLEFLPSLAMAKTSNGTVPVDCKMMVRIKDADPDLLGIQVQTTINTVQGTKHPYTYCVLIAKPEFALLKRAERVIDMPPRGGFKAGILADSNAKKEAKHARFAGALVELKTEGDTDILVVRQNTQGTGYATSPPQALTVFSAAYRLAKAVLEKGGSARG